MRGMSGRMPAQRLRTQDRNPVMGLGDKVGAWFEQQSSDLNPVMTSELKTETWRYIDFPMSL